MSLRFPPNVVPMTMRNVAIAAVLLISLTAGAAYVSRAEDKPTSKRAKNAPNVLIVITDDQRDGTIARLPNIKRLFLDQGVELKNAFSTTPVCCPARASIMSGRYVHNHHVRYFQPYNLDQLSTIQRHLQDSGYMTGFYGKYLNAWDLDDDPPFLTRWGIFPQSTSATYEGGRWNVNGVQLNFRNVYNTDALRELSSSFITESEEADGVPWFLVVSTAAPHEPWLAEEKYGDAPVGEWKGNPAVFDGTKDKPDYVRERVTHHCSFKCAQALRTAQLRTLYSVDDLVGSVFDELEAAGEAENTLAIYVSDNGLMWGEHGLQGKRYPYAPSVEVPMMMRWPARLDAGVDERFATNVDIAPTVADATGIPQSLNYPMDGRSLLDDEWDREEVLLEHSGVPDVPHWASLRGKGFQYIEYYTMKRPRTIKDVEYYDLRSDPWQTTNLLGDGDTTNDPPEQLIARYSRRLSKARTCSGSRCP